MSKEISDYTKAIELNPRNVDAYCNRGLAKGMLGDHAGAIEDFTKAIEINPANADAYNYRGIAKSMLEDRTDSMADFTKAIELNPKNADAYYFRGIIKGPLNDLQGAEEDFAMAIELNPTNADAYHYRGLAKAFQNNHAEAIEDFTKEIELSPNNADAYYNRGLVRGRLGDYSGRTSDLQKASELGSAKAKDIVSCEITETTSETISEAIAELWTIGVNSISSGDYDSARLHFWRILELESSKETANDTDYVSGSHYFLGIARLNLKDYSGAIENFSQAINRMSRGAELTCREGILEGCPAIADAYYHRGLAKIKLKDYDGANEDLYEAGMAGLDEAFTVRENQVIPKLLPPGRRETEKVRGILKKPIPYPIDCYSWGMNMWQEGDIEAALEAFIEETRRNPRNVDAYVAIASIKEFEDKHESIEYYDKAIEIDNNNAFLYLRRAVQKWDLGYYSWAIQDITKARDIDVNYVHGEPSYQQIMELLSSWSRETYYSMMTVSEKKQMEYYKSQRAGNNGQMLTYKKLSNGKYEYNGRVYDNEQEIMNIWNGDA